MPQTSQSLLLSKGRIGSLELEHRILMGAMHLGIEGDRGQLKQLQAFYLERVRGGAALIMTGNAAVLPEGGGHHMFCLTEPDHRSQLEELVGMVREAGGRLALQLAHTGRYAKSSETDLEPMAPSAIPSRLTRETPKEMTKGDIESVISAFVEGAVFAQEAGFAAIEIMGSEGYLLNEFVSPLTNHRQDEYGGDAVRRMKLCLDIAIGIRQRVGAEYPIIFRMSGDDYMPGSSTADEVLELARRLEAAGVDALNIGIGWHESSLPTVGGVVPSGAFAHIAAAIRSVVRIPIISANRIHTPDLAEKLIARGQMDFVAPARPWLADPLFARKTLEGDREGINSCISCNQACLDHTLGSPPKPVGCLVNPRAGRESEPFEKAVPIRSVAVVGGGVAGLQAALTAAQRGHKVTLFEVKDRLGGQFRLAGQIPGKSAFLETLRYFTLSLERLGVDIRLGVSPTPEELDQFDHVANATGVQPFIPAEIEGVELPLVCTYADLLSGAARLGRKIVIIGGGGIGSDVAHYIGEALAVQPVVGAFFEKHGMSATQTNPVQITLVSRSEKIARGVGPTSRWVLLGELKRRGVNVMKGYRCATITPHGVWIENEADRQFIEADQIVLCTGQRSRTELIEHNDDAIAIGGARNAAELDAARAIRQAYEWAVTL